MVIKEIDREYVDFIACEKCKGSGIIRNKKIFSKNKIVCVDCNGSGRKILIINPDIICICKRCKGTGNILNPNISNRIEMCPDCKGDGYFNWMDEVFGKSENKLYSGISGATGYSGISGVTGYSWTNWVWDET
jgi:DnaJ-class molecular chaperone